MKRKLIAGNWKMNGGLAQNQALLQGILAGLPANPCGVAVCVPAPYLTQVGQLVQGSAIGLGAQDVSAHEQGAYTGEVSVSMLKDFGVRYAIVGHSERRQYHFETDEAVALKAQRALAAGITPIVCVGETLAQREAGQTEEVVKRQLAAVIHLNGHCISEIVVAYEPVWAIGTGRTPTPEDVATVHAHIRAELAKRFQDAGDFRLLYGGSVKSSNVVEIMKQPDVDGALVGGASLDPEEFAKIAKFYAATNG